MPLNMSPSARYVTQTSVYETAYLGRLTNRRIAECVKQGRLSYPGSSGIKAFDSKNEPYSKAKQSKRSTSISNKPTLEQRKQEIKRILGDLI